MLLTSVLPRAIETAELVAPALNDLAARQDCDFCELHVGEADGLAWEEFRDRYWHEYRHDRYDRYRPLAPGGESWATFTARVGTALASAAAEHAGATIVDVCHGGVIESSLVALGNVPLQRGSDVAVGNTSLTEWTTPAEDRSRDRRWKLVRFNDCAHLAAHLSDIS